ncbi:MAG: FAD-dependent oxidoreductase [Alphaproteobacteria bacterium]
MDEAQSRYLDGTAGCDVVVVGSGAGGLTAAVTAAAHGLETVVLEKAPLFGGTSAIAGGGLWIPANPVAARHGIPDSLDAARTYFETFLGEDARSERVTAFLEQGPRMVSFLEERTAMRFFVAADRPDYYPDRPGATNGGRTIFPEAFDGRLLGPEIRRLRPPARELTFLGMMFKPGPELRHFLHVFRSWTSAAYVARRLLRQARDVALHGRAMELSNGNALVARLARSAFDLGVPILTGVAVEGLEADGNRVAGVRFRQDGREGVLRARRGVVLAAGGFPQDIERRSRLYKHAPSGTEHRSPAPETNTGDGLRMAETLGAAIPALTDAAAWAPVSAVPHGDGRTGAFPHLIDRQKPGFIAVTRHGRRFVNEANSYHEFCRGLARACAGEPEAYCYLIADHRTIRRYGIGFAKPSPVPLFPYLRSGYLLRGRTLSELAGRAGIDGDAFQATVDAFNRHARNGEDPQFGRGTSSYNRYNGDPRHKPNPCVAPVEQAPFYAVRIVIGDLGTFAGLATDAQARVLTAEGVPIPGLYAAGNDVSNVLGGNYMAGGSTLGPGMTFGYIAACDLATRPNTQSRRHRATLR